jgi:hypothetical protein
MEDTEEIVQASVDIAKNRMIGAAENTGKALPHPTGSS